MEKMRTTYRFVGGRKGRVSKINFESLRKGDLFFLENPNKEMVISEDGFVIFKALSKARIVPHPRNKDAINFGIKTKSVA